MRLAEWIAWAAVTVFANIITLMFFGLSWLPVIMVSLLIVVVFLMRQAVAAGLFIDYRKNLAARFGPVQASIFGLEWIECPSEKHGKHCDMHIFRNHVIFVTPDPLGKQKVHIHEVKLADVTQVKLNSDNTIHIVTAESATAKELSFRSTRPYDQLVGPLKTLQAELVQERQAQALRKVAEKAVKIEQELHRQQDERRRLRIERLHGAKGRNLVERFTAIIPSDIFIKDTLYEKIRELLLLELKGRKSTLQGRLEYFLENDFKPFAEVMRQKAGFDLEDYEDLCLLLQEIRNQVRQNARQSFKERYANLLDPVAESVETELISSYVRAAGSAVGEVPDLEGLRLYLAERGYHYDFKALRQRVEEIRQAQNTDSSNTKFYLTVDEQQLATVDQILYEVLWKPFGLPRDTRKQFRTGFNQLTFVAELGGSICGCLVTCEHEDAVEIRHMAVLPHFQGKRMGTRLLGFAIDYLQSKYGHGRLYVYARNNSVDFYLKQGFLAESNDWQDHPLFTPHGIRFKILSMYI